MADRNYSHRIYGEGSMQGSLKYLWRIEKFSYDVGRTNTFSSPCVVLGNIILNVELQIVSTYYGYNCPSEDKIIIIIKGIPRECRQVKIHAVLKNTDGVGIASMMNNNDFCHYDSDYMLSTEGEIQSVSSQLAVNRVLDVIFKIDMSTGHLSLNNNKQASSTSQVSQHVTSESLNPFAIFFQSEECSDLKLIVEGKKILAHKMVLFKHSPVFKAMLSIDMKEKSENVINIDDNKITYNTFLEALRFMYRGEIVNLKVIANDLMYIAEKYDVQDLKEVCIKTLSGALNYNNALEIYETASLHCVEKLKKDAFEFIISNFLPISDHRLIMMPETDKLALVNMLRNIELQQELEEN